MGMPWGCHSDAIGDAVRNTLNDLIDPPTYFVYIYIYIFFFCWIYLVSFLLICYGSGPDPIS